MTSILKKYAKLCECGSSDLHIKLTSYRVDEDIQCAVSCRSCGNVGEYMANGELAIMAWNDWNVLELFKCVEALERVKGVDESDEHGMVKRGVVVDGSAKCVEVSSYKQKQDAWIVKHKLSVGDKVKVTRRAEDFEGGWMCKWASVLMDSSVGKTFEVRAFEDGYGVELNGTECAFPYFVLEVVK